MRAKRLLLIVEDAFAIAGRGTIVAPDVDLGDATPQRLTVELRRPDGTVMSAEASAHVPFIDPPSIPPRARHVLVFPTMTKADLPAGTEIWI